MGKVAILDLIRGLEEMPEAGFGRDVTDYLRAHPLDEDSLHPFAFWVPGHYTRNLVHKARLFEVLLLCWEPGQVSRTHNHRDQQCWMTMAAGKLLNENYRVLERDEAARRCRLEASARVLITPDSPLEVDEDEPVHQVINEGGQRAVSVHIYSRPFDTCEVYCLRTGTFKDVQLTYFSEYGRRVDPAPGDACTASPRG